MLAQHSHYNVPSLLATLLSGIRSRCTAFRSMQVTRNGKQLTEYLRASNRSLSARRSTASCSSPKVFTQLAAPHEAVLTCKNRASMCQTLNWALYRLVRVLHCFLLVHWFLEGQIYSHLLISKSSQAGGSTIRGCLDLQDQRTDASAGLLEYQDPG